MTYQHEIAGWALAIETERLGGGTPMWQLYAASLPNEADARSLATQRLGLAGGEKIVAAYPLSTVTIATLRMEPGELDVL